MSRINEQIMILYEYENGIDFDSMKLELKLEFIFNEHE